MGLPERVHVALHLRYQRNPSMFAELVERATNVC